MTIFYLISIIILFISFIIIKKNEREINVLSFIFLSIVILLCYNAFICYVLTFLTIPIKLWILAIINIIVSLFFIIPIIKNKNFQKYYFKKIDLLYIGIIAIVSIIVAYMYFGFPFNVNSESGDASFHFFAANMFAKLEKLLLATNEFDPFYGNLSGIRICSYVNSGLIMKCFCKSLDTFQCYNIFTGFDVFILFLTGITFYFSIRNFAKNKEHMLWSFILAIICMLGYPLNSMIFGFTHLSMGILMIPAIINFMYYYKRDDFKLSFFISIMFLLSFGLFASYYMFVPFMYPALWIYFCIDNYKRTKKLITKELLMILSITLLIPFILGFIYYMLPNVYLIFANEHGSFVGELVSNTLNTGFKSEGYTYINLYSNMVLLIPAIIYILFKDKKKNIFILLLTFLCIMFIGILLVGNILNKVSMYYVSKNYYALWIILLYSVGISFLLLSEKGKYFPRLFIAAYIILMIVCTVLSNVEVVYKTKNDNERITSVMEIFQANKTVLLNKPIELNQEELEILKYAKGNLDPKTKVDVVSDEGTYYWTHVLVNFVSNENEYKNELTGPRSLATKSYYIERKINKVDYMIYFTNSNRYKKIKNKLFQNSTIIYENSAGGIIKYNR